MLRRSIVGMVALSIWYVTKAGFFGLNSFIIVLTKSLFVKSLAFLKRPEVCWLVREYECGKKDYEVSVHYFVIT